MYTCFKGIGQSCIGRMVEVERENGLWRLVVKNRRYSISTGKWLRLLGNDDADVSSFETQNDVRVDANMTKALRLRFTPSIRVFLLKLHRPAFPAEEVFRYNAVSETCRILPS